jgi:hypothetical protein
LAKYWTGEPLVFVCRKKQKEGETGEPETYFVVSFELVGESAETVKEGGEEDVNEDVD